MLRLLMTTSLFDLVLLNYSVLKLILRSWVNSVLRQKRASDCQVVTLMSLSWIFQCKDESGLSLLEEIPSGIASIMLSVHDSPAMVEKSLELGAKGYLSKRCSPDELIQAVHTSANGGCYLTPDIAIKLATPLKNKASLNQLTRRESEVCQLLATGLDVKSIAVELGVSHKTVHVHRANAMDKLNVKNNVELAKLFTQEQY